MVVVDRDPCGSIGDAEDDGGVGTGSGGVIGGVSVDGGGGKSERRRSSLRNGNRVPLTPFHR